MYDNVSMSQQQDRNIRLFVDSAGRLTDLLSQLKIKTTEVQRIGVKVPTTQRGFAFVEMSAEAAEKAIRALNQEPAKAGSPAIPGKTGPQKRSRPASAQNRIRSERVSTKLLIHAAETFGSEQSARRWLMSECGALDNRTPLQFIEDAGDDTRVERVLDCIDYGMIA